MAKEQTFDQFHQELEEALAVNKNSLDDDTKKHAQLYHQVADRLALEVSRRDAAKQALSEAEAHADEEIRYKADTNDEKITEPMVKSRVALHKGVRAARMELHQLNYMVGRLNALEESFKERNKAMKLLVDLYVAGYWSISSGIPYKEDRTQRIKRDLHNLRQQRGGKHG